MSHKVVDSRFLDLIDEYAPVRQIATGCVFTEGPIWHPTEHHLLFSDIPGDVRRKWTPDGRVVEVQRPANKGNGMTYDADLNLLICEHSTSSVIRLRPDGRREILCSHYQGRELNSPNDIVVGNNGAIYFTDPSYGRMEHFGIPRPTQQSFQGVYMLPPGHRPGDEPLLVVDKYMFTQPNGLTFSPCQRWMWVNDSDQFNIRMFDVAPDGQLTNARIFASGIKEAAREGMPDGMKADVNGNVYVTGPGGIWVYSFEGIKLGEIETPEKPANLHWGGEGWQSLYITATTGVYAVETKTAGRTEPFMFPVVGAPSSGPSGPSSAASHAARPAAPASAAEATPALRLDGGRCALILQDLQNDVLIDGGAFAGSGSPDHARAQNVIANAARLAAACRNAGVMVIHVHFICEPGHPHLTDNAPLFQGLKGANALVRGTWGAQAASGIEPQAGDLVVEKMSMSAWETSRLESYLRHGGRDTIINAGAWTNMSVEHTARTGADKGFRIVLPEDACSTMNADWHRASIDFAMGNVAEVTDVDAVIASLK